MHFNRKSQHIGWDFLKWHTAQLLAGFISRFRKRFNFTISATCFTACKTISWGISLCKFYIAFLWQIVSFSTKNFCSHLLAPFWLLHYYNIHYNLTINKGNSLLRVALISEESQLELSSILNSTRLYYVVLIILGIIYPQVFS